MESDPGIWSRIGYFLGIKIQYPVCYDRDFLEGPKQGLWQTPALGGLDQGRHGSGTVIFSIGS